MEKLFVIKIINTEQAELRKWYRKKSGRMIVCRLSDGGAFFTTYDSIDDKGSVGIIEPQFCRVMTSFKCEDSY